MNDPAPALPYRTPPDRPPGAERALRAAAACNGVWGVFCLVVVASTRFIGGTSPLRVEVMMAAAGVAVGLAGLAMHRRRARWFAVVAAVPNLVVFPVGSALAIATVVILLHPRVAALFARPASGREQASAGSGTEGGT
ncbi:MAG: hypothetical protein JWO31_1975 [Phycisphaerales bacterium]|nr:hypothetical protein [Phycisphaerales bacterium]